MTFDELVTEVYNLTGRDDLVEMTKSAIKAATLKAHQTDFYSKDIFETAIKFDEPAYRQSFDYISLIPNYRALKYLRQYDPVKVAGEGAGKYFEVLTPDNVLDAYQRERQDICYVAGRVIEIRASIMLETALLGCYVLPLITEGKYSSWVAELYPYAIIHEAARFIFGAIAMTTEKAAQESMVAEQYAELKINALTDVGS